MKPEHCGLCNRRPAEIETRRWGGICRQCFESLFDRIDSKHAKSAVLEMRKEEDPTRWRIGSRRRAPRRDSSFARQAISFPFNDSGNLQPVPLPSSPLLVYDRPISGISSIRALREEKGMGERAHQRSKWISGAAPMYTFKPMFPWRKDIGPFYAFSQV